MDTPTTFPLSRLLWGQGDIQESDAEAIATWANEENPRAPKRLHAHSDPADLKAWIVWADEGLSISVSHYSDGDLWAVVADLSGYEGLS